MMRLRIADTFMQRLLGLHAYGPLAADEGLLITPCSAIHTWFLGQSLDIVFLGGDGAERRCVQNVPPYRMVGAPGACMVVELPAGYCRRHPDYLRHIHAAFNRLGGSTGKR